jgi:23S rRNA pseudouridine2457 synthase
MTLLMLNKPYGVICQFSRDGDRPTLADLVPVKQVYPAGRLDTDSEGLVLLTDDGALQHRISDPRFKLPKTYWAEVEGIPTPSAIDALRHGVDLKDGKTLPCHASVMPRPELWTRDPPIRVRAAIPTSWIELQLTEGRNRQVRRMTAAIGYPTLRLVRVAIGSLNLLAYPRLESGQWRVIDPVALR